MQRLEGVHTDLDIYSLISDTRFWKGFIIILRAFNSEVLKSLSHLGPDQISTMHDQFLRKPPILCFEF